MKNYSSKSIIFVLSFLIIKLDPVINIHVTAVIMNHPIHFHTNHSLYTTNVQCCRIKLLNLIFGVFYSLQGHEIQF